MFAPGASVRGLNGRLFPRRAVLTLLRGYRLKGGNLLFDFSALTFRASFLFLFIFRDRHKEGERLFALLTLEFIRGHSKPPVISVNS